MSSIVPVDVVRPEHRGGLPGSARGHFAAPLNIQDAVVSAGQYPGREAQVFTAHAVQVLAVAFFHFVSRETVAAARRDAAGHACVGVAAVAIVADLVYAQEPISAEGKRTHHAAVALVVVGVVTGFAILEDSVAALGERTAVAAQVVVDEVSVVALFGAIDHAIGA